MIIRLRRESEGSYTVHEISHASDNIYDFMKRNILPYESASFSKYEGLAESETKQHSKGSSTK
ncbi:hypothetical protein AAF712_008460 [Marasmius tenuissimus]|uniref:Uncharacterized protein n=1 Tax=Marasmius tenuissimus TaxID=585030 RepID=A0ABR2ZTA4_9AGAR